MHVRKCERFCSAVGKKREARAERCKHNFLQHERLFPLFLTFFLRWLLTEGRLAWSGIWAFVDCSQLAPNDIQWELASTIDAVLMPNMSFIDVVLN